MSLVETNLVTYLLGKASLTSLIDVRIDPGGNR